MASPPASPGFRVGRSPIHGTGVFALRRIPAGTRIVEYLGERITDQEADSRYDDDEVERPHVLLFRVDRDTVIDAGRDGNEARFINHSCDPNCEAVLDRGRIFVQALRDIPPGAELTYDYQLEDTEPFTPERHRQYACRCGALTCRGTMLALRSALPRRRRAARDRARRPRRKEDR